MVISVSLVHPCGCEFDWERLPLKLASIMKEDCVVYHQPRKKSKFKIQIMISTACVSLDCKVEKIEKT